MLQLVSGDFVFFGFGVELVLARGDFGELRDFRRIWEGCGYLSLDLQFLMNCGKLTAVKA